jgi:hypothetical protein
LHVGVNEIKEKVKTLIVFPNPSNSILNFYSEISTSGQLLISDALGKNVLKAMLNNGRAIIQNLPAGIYSVRLMESGRMISVEKFIVTK